ncbi:MAG: efflux RND transporter periplasmic adaptor subunit [Gammaproteobacteria bacterium]|nr:efflux RND transporter periplasmic adaptor subunit [Gammaproteobacteria bacterium]
MQFFKSRRTAIIIAALGLLLGGMLLLGKQDEGGNETKSVPVAKARPALTVVTAQPQATRLPVQLTASGDVAIWQEASIGTEADGWRLEAVRVDVGDTVRKGEVLATFASEMIRANLAQASAAVAEAEAEAKKAVANADRARNPRASGALTAQQVNEYLTAEQVALARVDVARSAEAVQRLRLKQTYVVAPDDGIISARSVAVGAVLGSGAELFRLIRQGRLEWRAEVTAAELGRIKPGVAVTLSVAGGERVSGRVRMIGPIVDTKKRSAVVYVDLPAGAPVKAGMFATGQFELGASEALTVPQQAVVIRDGFSYVYRLNPDGRVSQIRVDTGRRLGERVEIVQGVERDTLLVSSGAGFLNDGDLVKNVTPAVPAAPAASN